MMSTCCGNRPPSLTIVGARHRELQESIPYSDAPFRFRQTDDAVRGAARLRSLSLLHSPQIGEALKQTADVVLLVFLLIPGAQGCLVIEEESAGLWQVPFTTPEAVKINEPIGRRGS